MTSPHVVMTISVAIFAANYVVGRGVYEDCPPILLSFVRWAGASVLLLPFVWTRMRAQRALLRAEAARIAACGLLMPVIGSMVAYIGLTMTYAVTGAIVQTSMPILVVILAWLARMERIGYAQIGGIALSLAGVAALVARGDSAALLALDFNLGDLVLLVSNIGLAAYTILVRGLPRQLDPVAVLVPIFAIGAAIHVPLVGVEYMLGKTLVLTDRALFGLAFVAVFPPIFGVFTWNYAIGRLGPNVTSTYWYLMPPFTASLGWVFLGETIALYHIIGTVMVIAGVILTARAKTQPAVAKARA